MTYVNWHLSVNEAFEEPKLCRPLIMGTIFAHRVNHRAGQLLGLMAGLGGSSWWGCRGEREPETRRRD